MPAKKTSKAQGAKPKAAAPSQSVKPNGGGLPSYLSRGYDAADAAYQRQENNRRRSPLPWRFFLKNGETAKIVFLDDACIGCNEHVVRNAPGSPPDFFTCIGGLEKDDPTCPLCMASAPYFIGSWTIMDNRSWTDKEGKIHKFQKRVLCAKTQAAQKYKEFSLKHGGLRGCLFEVARGVSQQAWTVGDVIQFKRKLSEAELKKLFGSDTKPVDYGAFFEVRSREEMERALARVGGAASNVFANNPVGSQPPFTPTKEDPGAGDPSIDFE